jgi:tetratricopeptide (TPR) repeat protein
VIHRDLKPNNILVQEDGAPKLLDFGIAKLLDRAHSAETTLAPPFTPAYASPEQIRGEPITTASDVYSLGVLLYQLLTGHSPYSVDRGSSLQLARAVCETEPVRPSTVILRPPAIRDGDAAAPSTAEELCLAREGSPVKLRRRLAGDLDDIVLKALRKEPEQRYPSVEQLSEDIRRHVEGLPIMARKGSFRYRAGKFVGRNKIGVAAAAVVLLAILSGTAATAWQARIAREQAEIAQLERTRAERRFNDVRKLANSMIFELHDSIQNLPGATASRKLIVERALEYLDSLAAEGAGDPTLRVEIAHAYRRIADVQGNPHEANLGDAAGAVASYRKAQDLLEHLVAARPADGARQLDLARTLLGVGDMQVTMRDAQGALGNYRRALGIAEQLEKASPTGREMRRVLAASHYRVADALAHVQARKEAADHLERAIPIYRALAADAGDVESQLALVRAFKALGIMRGVMGDAQGNVALMQKAYGLGQTLAVTHPLNVAFRNEVAMSSMELGHAYARANNLADALRSFREAEAITASMAEADPSNAQARWMRGIELNNVGDVLRRMRRHREALAEHQKALALSEALARADPSNESYAFIVADTSQFIGETYVAMAHTARSNADQRDSWSHARSWFRRSAAVFQAMHRRRALASGREEAADARHLADHVAQRVLLCDREVRRLSHP